MKETDAAFLKDIRRKLLKSLENSRVHGVSLENISRKFQISLENKRRKLEVSLKNSRVHVDL